jgi:ankyrin repeat protein
MHMHRYKLTSSRFLLARLHIDSLSDKTTAKEVKITLATLSRGAAALNDAYDEALERIEGQQAGHSRIAMRVLAWITFAKRPLTTSELCCALAVEFDEAELDPENKPDVEDLVSVCAGLVVVDQESAIIRLVHYTTQEYFESLSSYFNPATQLLIAKTCLTYLSFSVFESGSCATDEDFEERLHQHELLDYAARYCGEHAKCVEPKVAEGVRSFLTHDGLLASSVQVLYAEPSYKYQGYSGRGLGFTGLHWAARFGLCEVAKGYLRLKGEDVHAVNVVDSEGRDSLMIAADYGHYEMAKLLLDMGAQANAHGGYHGTAFQAASYGGHEAVVRLLLDKGANINAQGGFYGTALEAALYGGYEAIVKLLLEKGADINAQGEYYGNALQAASSGGHEALVELLLDKGANINAQGGVYGTALPAASYGGHEAVVKLLLDKGANINAQGGVYGNALQAASYGGHKAVVKLLLDKGAHINSQSDYGNALQTASYRGYKAIVKLLLDKGADINAQNEYYGNALQAASYGGHEAVVKLLLNKGGKVHATANE